MQILLCKEIPTLRLQTYLSAEDVDSPGDEPLEHPPEREVVVVRRHVLRYEPVPQQQLQPSHRTPHLLRVALLQQRFRPHEALFRLSQENAEKHKRDAGEMRERRKKQSVKLLR